MIGVFWNNLSIVMLQMMCCQIMEYPITQGLQSHIWHQILNI